MTIPGCIGVPSFATTQLIVAIFIKLLSTFCNSFHKPDTDITDTRRTITKNNDQTINEPSNPVLWEPCPFCTIKNVYGTNGTDGDDRMNSATRQLFFFCFTTFETCCFRYYRMSNIFDKIINCI
ncbi:hypothetical protein QTP88_012220 [Uroleucon formosanum]